MIFLSDDEDENNQGNHLEMLPTEEFNREEHSSKAPILKE